MTVTRMIPVGQIDRAPVPASPQFDPMSFTELAEAVADLGKRITVRREATGRYRLVMGESQYAAAHASRAHLIEATVLNVPSDPRALRLLRAVAGKVDTGEISPLEEAAMFRRLTEAGYLPYEIAEECGKFPTYIRWRIELLDLVPAGQTALSKGRLPLGLAWYVSRLPAPQQEPFLNRWLRGEFPGAPQAEYAARTLQPAT
ncbi:ParB/RepB/Spo0J family partition protein [Streptomyces goshikiensis]|uniref:ParB/RepB/Spo0J family partition protein n=1 Tax=Streptomyces goshikiensis TaxID=1942 RepID=UPI0036599E0B